LLIDVNTYIGHWAFRRLRHNTAEALVRRMDEHGIDRAVVGSVHGILYKNAHAANEELAEQTRPYRDRLIPFATLNPAYAGWREDLRRCAQEGSRGVRRLRDLSTAASPAQPSTAATAPLGGAADEWITIWLG